MASKEVADRQEVTPNETAWMITGRLLSGMILYGGIGWLLSLWLGHRSLFIAGGILFGMAASLYLVFARLKHENEQMQQELDRKRGKVLGQKDVNSNRN